MRAGLMRERVTIQESTITRGAAGSEVKTWVEFATVWAAVQPISGREFTRLRAAQAEETTRFRVRYLAGVLPTMRIVWKTQVYKITEVINLDARNRELEIYGSAEVV